MRYPHHSTVAAYLALFLALGGTAAAATGGTFTLGRSNAATTTTTLTDTHSVPLVVKGSTGRAPLAVNSKVKVANLNADRLDGIDSPALQRRVGSCPDGSAIRAIAASGAVTCVGVSTGAAPPAAPSQGQSKGWTISDMSISQDSSGDFQAVARLTNDNAATQTATFTVTVFNAGAIVGTLHTTLNSVPAGATFTGDFVSSDTFTSFDSWTFQTDSAFNG